MSDEERAEGTLQPFTFIECFSGIGGFRLGLEAIGGTCVWACESDKNATMVYEANHTNPPYHDIREADPTKIPRYDMLTGGFPCQDFSGAGEQRGLEGERGALFFALLRIIEATKPPLLFLENVRGLVTMDGGSAMRRVIRALEDAGYSCRYGLRNCDGLLPQFRRRVYIFGFLDDAAATRFQMPGSPELSPRPVMSDILEPAADPLLRHYTLTPAMWRRSFRRS